jgi:hypothetical protein
MLTLHRVLRARNEPPAGPNLTSCGPLVDFEPGKHESYQRSAPHLHPVHRYSVDGYRNSHHRLTGASLRSGEPATLKALTGSRRCRLWAAGVVAGFDANYRHQGQLGICPIALELLE